MCPNITQIIIPSFQIIIFLLIRILQKVFILKFCSQLIFKVLKLIKELDL